MAYALDRRLLLEDGPSGAPDRALQARRAEALAQPSWRALSPDQRWALAREALGLGG